MVSQFQHLLEGIIDEDEAYETGEALFSEAGEVLDQEAGIGGHQDQAEERWPQADPQTELQIIKLIVSACRSKTSTQNQWKSICFSTILPRSVISISMKGLLRIQKAIVNIVGYDLWL